MLRFGERAGLRMTKAILAPRTSRARTPPSVISPLLLPLCDSQVGQVATHPQATNSRPTAGMVSGASRAPAGTQGRSHASVVGELIPEVRLAGFQPQHVQPRQ